MEDRKFKSYFFIIDGEVVWRHDIEDSEAGEMMNAVFSSNPTIVPATAEQATTVEYGWLWDGENFSNPEGDDNVGLAGL